MSAMKIFSKISKPMWPRYLNVTDRQTDGRAKCHSTAR